MIINEMFPQGEIFCFITRQAAQMRLLAVSGSRDNSTHACAAHHL
jgi:hypothetical protein